MSSLAQSYTKMAVTSAKLWLATRQGDLEITENIANVKPTSWYFEIPLLAFVLSVWLYLQDIYFACGDLLSTAVKVYSSF